ncbi:uncharacterized protein [Clytia hemisphaerica]|uniref:C2H2-type domain-containing protein n=1 Tax=Clytia hemisphaerica TaxID=252671 RepID=A0A7M5VDA2_9CNID
MVAVAHNETLIHARELNEGLVMPGMKLDAHTTLVVPSYEGEELGKENLFDDNKITRQDSGYDQIDDSAPRDKTYQEQEEILRRVDVDETSSDSGLNEENLDEEEFEKEESDRLVMMDENIDVDEGVMTSKEINAENEKLRQQSLDGQVVIYENGTPILKVESGTTLEVVKLLYGTERSSQDNIIGVRPRQKGASIPCIITLKDSRLEENSYDVITKGGPVRNSFQNDVTSNEDCSTTRCIECSRESWKTKRYTSVGMNTEISINPLLENDATRSITAGVTKQKSSQSKDHAPPAPKRGRPPLNRQPAYANVHPKEFIVAPIPGMAPPSSEMEYRHYRRAQSPRRTAPAFAHTKIYPPSVDLDNVPYEPIRAIHHPIPPPHHQARRLSPPLRMVKMESERHSPPMPPSRYARAHSPIPYKGGYAREEERPREIYRDFHSSQMKGEDSKRRRWSPKYYPYELPPPPGALVIPQPPYPTPSRQQTSAPKQKEDQEPQVYVLPEDFDMEKDPFDPVSMTSQDSKDSTDSNISKQSESVRSPDTQPPATQSPATMSSPKAKTTETARPPQPLLEGAPPGEHKLSCKICKQSFPTKSTLYKHLRGHSSDEKPFKCNECGQGFTLSSNLRQHRIIHRGYKPFQCEYCGKKFMRSNVYKQHRRIHTGEQMHKCDLCPSEFLQKYALVKHLKKVHNIETYEN